MEILNRKAHYDYFIEETIEAGIVLTGTEIKSIRAGSANIRDSYAIIRNDEVFLLNMFIAHYKEGNLFNHEESRSRKLLLHKKEIRKLKDKRDLHGFTLVPLKVYFKDSKAKILLGVCRGKKNYDKREAIKERDQRIEMQRLRNMKYR